MQAESLPAAAAEVAEAVVVGPQQITYSSLEAVVVRVAVVAVELQTPGLGVTQEQRRLAVDRMRHPPDPPELLG